MDVKGKIDAKWRKYNMTVDYGWFETNNWDQLNFGGKIK